MESHYRRARFRLEHLSPNSESDDPLLSARANYATGMRGRGSAIAWWAGLRFDDLLRAYPPMSQAKWARVESSVNLDESGNPDPYAMSIDLATARHPQTLLATHFNGQPLIVDHGAPLRPVPVKLGLKNVKAITRISYSVDEPRDYWAERGYSRYDGI